MDLFNKGQKIALYIQKENTMVEMFCEIDTIENDRLILVLPQYFMRYVDLLQVGTSLTAKVFSKLGTIDFNTIVITSPLEDYFSIELDYNALKLNDGDDIPMVGAMENIELKNKSGHYKSKTFELSSKHIKFYSDEDIKLEQTFDCTISLPKDYGIITFRGTVTEKDPIYENEYTIQIDTITEVDKQALLYYMYLYSNDSD